MRSLRLTIPSRIFLAFAAVLVAFGVVSVTSVVRHQRIAATLRLLDEAYIPLALALGESKASEAVVQNMLEYVLDERDSRRTRQWLGSSRQVIPTRLSQALRAVERAEDRNAVALAECHETLLQIAEDYEANQALYESMFAALDDDRRELAASIHERIVRREGQLARQLLVLRNRVQQEIEEISRRAAEQESRSVYEIAALALIALLAGLAVMGWSQRLLAPLPRLQERVAAVARGDLSVRLAMNEDDEIGRLATEFERMVNAVAARDRQLRDAAESVLELQRVQEQIVASLRSAVVVVGAEGLLEASNRAAQSTLGLDRSALGTPIAAAPVHQQLEALQHAIRAVAEGGAPTTIEAAEIRTGEGAARYVDILVTPFGTRDDPESTTRQAVLVVADDVTEALRTKSRLIQTERLAAIGKMAAHVTHEVRNPLSSIGLNVDLLGDELGDSGPSVAKLLRSIHREIDRLTAITEEYLRLARVPAPRLLPEDLGALVGELVRFIRPEIEAAGSTLELDVAPGLPWISADEAQIRQALLNLIRNASEAMPNGGPISVTLLCSDEGGVRVEVGDRGGGIQAERRENIFDLFFTTKERGTGLGLPLTQQIVIAHGGRIRCLDREAGGTVFELWFPALEANETAEWTTALAVDERVS